MEKQQFIEAGKVVNTHGVKGEVKIQVWLDSPEFLKKFKTVYPACGNSQSAVKMSLEELEDASNYVSWIDVCKE